MKKKFLISLLVIAVLTSISVLTVMGAESLTCDEGPIKDVSIQIDGIWYKRPDSRIDGLPVTDKLGPFPVRARLVEDSGIAGVDLYFSIAGTSGSHVPMTIDGNTVSGKIPRFKDMAYGDISILFYLRAYDEEGQVVWLDEIPYSCDPYDQGDPYIFRINKSYPVSPFIGQWRADDLDGSHIQLSIGGGGNGNYIFTQTDDYWSICGGDPGIGRGVGTLVDPSTIFTELVFYCPSQHTNGGYPFDFTYNADDDTLIQYFYYIPGFEEEVVIWSRVGH